jgi:hypothetical protein
MDEQGLIVRSAHPRHPNVLELHISAAGREALHAGRQCVEPIEQGVIAAFLPEELKNLAVLLERLIAVTDPYREVVSSDPGGKPDHGGGA